MRFAFADPPYIGQAKKHYTREAAADGRIAAEVDHAQLVGQLMAYDGWALCLSSPTLKQILSLCPDDVRIGAWVKPFASFKPNVNPGYCWEPVIFWGGRPLGRDVPTVRDYVSANITLQRGVSGAKPETFSVWVFQMLGMKPEDELDDLFPGSGAVTSAWEKWRAQIGLECPREMTPDERAELERVRRQFYSPIQRVAPRLWTE